MWEKQEILQKELQGSFWIRVKISRAELLNSPTVFVGQERPKLESLPWGEGGRSCWEGKIEK